MEASPSTFAALKRRLYSRSVHELGKSGPAASRFRPIPSRQPSVRAASLLALAKEPEDAGITGGTRSLDRRLLALNFASPRLAMVVS